MNNLKTMFSEDFLNHAAYLLYSTTSTNFYIRKAKQLSEDKFKDAVVVDRLLANPKKGDSFIEYVQSIWTSFRKSKARNDFELILAVLIPFAAKIFPDESKYILKQIAFDDGSHTAWIAALSRNLYRSRITNHANKFADTYFDDIAAILRTDSGGDTSYTPQPPFSINNTEVENHELTLA